MIEEICIATKSTTVPVVHESEGMVDTLASKARGWELERGIDFTYDGVHVLSMLEEYNILRREKEEDKRRQRDQVLLFRCAGSFVYLSPRYLLMLSMCKIKFCFDHWNFRSLKMSSAIPMSAMNPRAREVDGSNMYNSQNISH